VATKLDLVIELDASGAVKGVKSLNTEVDKLGTASQVADKKGGSLFGTITGGVIAANLATKALSFLGNEMTSVFSEALEAEKVQSKLNSTLRAQGEDVKLSGELWDNFASQMQAMTGESDEAVKALVTLSYNLGIARDKTEIAIQGAIGLTTIYGGSMQSNLEAVARAYQGNWRQVDMLIPEVKALTSESDKLALMQKKMEEGFIASTDAMKTHGGQLLVIKNNWNDFKESVGNALLTLWDGVSKVSGVMNSQTAIFNKLKEQKEYEAEQLKINEQLNRTYNDVLLKEVDSFDKLNAVEQGNVIGLMQLVGILPKMTGETNTNTAAVVKHTQAIKSEGDAYAELLAKMPPAQAGLVEMKETQIEISDAVPKLSKDLQGQASTVETKTAPAVEKLTDKWQELEAQLQAIDRAIGYVDDMFSALGINASGVTSQIGKGLGAASMFSSGMASLNKEGGSLTDTLTGVTSIIGAVSAAITIVTGLIKMFAGDGVGEAIKRENQWMELNEQLEKQLRDLAKETGSVHEATSIMLDDIIEQTDVTIDNFGQYANRIREILSELDRGEFTLAQTQNEIGDSFEALISKAEELGTSGSNSLLTLFDDLKSRGIEVAEITKYIHEQMTEGLDGYKKYLEGGFSDATIGVFEEMLAYEKKVGENQALIDGVQGMTDALVHMSNATRLNETEFDSFEKAAQDAFAALTAKGFTEKESLVEMAPMLSRLVFLQQEYGLTVDAATQALIDKAKAEGVNLDQYKSQEEIFASMDKTLREIADTFAKLLPNAIGATTDAFRNLNKEANGFDPDTSGPDLRSPGPDIQAASGFYSPGLPRDTLIQAHRGEPVLILPKGQRGEGGGKSSTTNVNMTLSGSITPEIVADAFLAAYRGNRRGLRSVLQGGN
jgi:hypothetical protein